MLQPVAVPTKITRGIPCHLGKGFREIRVVGADAEARLPKFLVLSLLQEGLAVIRHQNHEIPFAFEFAELILIRIKPELRHYVDFFPVLTE